MHIFVNSGKLKPNFMIKTILTFILITMGSSVLFAQDTENSDVTKSAFSVNISPNPATSQISISANANLNVQVKMVDVLGNLILSESFTDGSGKLDITKYRNGIYFIKIEAEGVRTITRKLIIRH